MKTKYNYYFYTLLSILIVILFFLINTLSISYKEALNVFVNQSVLSFLTNISIYVFGQNDISLRLPFLIFYILSVLLMYEITNGYFKYEKDRFISIFIFMILPGVLSASILVNSAIVVLFFVLLYIYYYQKYKKHNYYLLFIFIFIDNSFSILYLALFFYSLKNKNNTMILISSFLFGISMYIYGFDTSGKPQGFILDTFAIYMSIFSPLIFLYFIYSIYRIGIKGEKEIVWYISTTALILSFIFSFRQKIYIEDFAPFVVIALPFVLKMFFNSYRVRLKQFRKGHNLAIIITLLILFLNIMLSIFNKPLYLVLPNIKKHFVYKYHFAKHIAQELKSRGINNVESNNEDLLLRLRYYGINTGKEYFISLDDFGFYNETINIDYYGKNLLTLYIIKIVE